MKLVHTIRQFGCGVLLALAATSSNASEIKLPDLSSSSDALVLPDQASRYGQNVKLRLRSIGALIDDPLLDEYVESLGYRMVSHSQTPSANFDFFWLDNNAANAFATFGGFIAVHTGLLLMVDSESELAAVLAHEVAHVNQGHLSRAMEKMQNIALPVMLASVATAIAAGGDGAGAALVTGAAAMQQAQINFTRANEYEADRVGILTLHDAGFDPAAMATVFARFGAQESEYTRENFPEQLRTHPTSRNRIAEARNRAAKLPHRGRGDSPEFAIAQARARALYTDSALARGHFERELKYQSDPVSRMGAVYGLALLDIKQHQANQARERLEDLLEEFELRALQLARAEAMFKAGQREAAIDYAAELYKLYPDNRAAELNYGQLLLEAGRFESAQDVFEQMRWGENASPEIYRLLAEAADGAGDRLIAQEAMGNFYARSGRIREALDQYQRIISNPAGDYYLRSRVEAQLMELRKDFEELYREVITERRRRSLVAQ